MKTTIYTPQNKYSIIKIFQDILDGFKDGNDLARRLFLRDLRASYKRSFIGVFWLFIPSLFTAGIWMFLNSQDIVSISETPMDYAAFVLCGSLLWSLFAESMNKPLQRYQGAMSMMSKLNFPREAIFLAAVYDTIFSFLLKLLILVPVLWVLGYPPGIHWFPALYGIIGLVIIGLTLGLIISPLGLLYGDIGKGLPLILPFAMYLTPVIYPLRESGTLSVLQGINPVTPFLELARSSMGGYEFSLNFPLMVWSILILFGLIFSLVAIRVALPIIVERNGS